MAADVNPDPPEVFIEENLPDLQDDLYHVRHKWYDIGLRIGLNSTDLDPIKYQNRDDFKDSLRDMLKLRLSRAKSLSKGDLLEALRNPSIGEDDLAAKLEEEYFPRSPSESEVLPFPVEESQAHGHTDDVAMEGNDNTRHSPEHGSGSEDLTIVRARLEKERLVSEFEHIAIEIKRELKTKMTVSDFQDKFLRRLSPSRKAQHLRYFEQNLEKLVNQTTYDGLFFFLNLYWDYLNYSLLETIVKEFGSREIKRRMEKFCKDVKSFRGSTTLRVFLELEHDEEHPPPPDGFQTWKSKHNITLDSTLEDVNKVRIRVTYDFQLHEFALNIALLEFSSVFVGVDRVRHNVQKLKTALDNEVGVPGQPHESLEDTADTEESTKKDFSDETDKPVQETEESKSTEEADGADESDVKSLEAEKKSQILAAAKKGTVLVNSRNILITGPGGAGKTCLVRIMSGEEPLEIYNSTGVFNEARRVASLTMICQTHSDKEVLLKKKFTLLKGDALLKFMACGTKSHKSEAGQDNTADISDPSASTKPLNSEAFNKPLDFETSPDSKTPIQPLDSENSNQQPDSEVSTDPETNAAIEEFLSDVAEYLENHPTDPIAEVDLFYIIDSGGQLQFHEMLHKFVSKVHCAVYVINVNDQPDDPVLDQFFVNGKAEGKPYRSQYTHEQLFMRSLQALQLQTSVDQKPASTESAASDAKSTHLAVVATHIDEMEIEDAIEKKHKWVVDIARAACINDEDIVYPGSCLDEPVHALDASSLSKSQESVSEFLETLRGKIEGQKEEIPLGRFILEETMRKAAEESSGIVSVDKCREIGRLVAMSSKSVEEELRILNDHNRILYIPDVSQEIAFCDVQTPLSVLKQLAQYSALARNDPELKSANIPKDIIKDPASLLKLLKEGTLTEEVLVKHAASFFKHGFTPQIFLKLMEKYRIIAKQCSQDKTPKDQEKVLEDQDQSAQAKYFMPCILREAPGRVLEARRKSDVEPLLLYFGEWPEAGKFCTLVTQLVSQKQWQPRTFLKEKYLYRNCITFNVKEPRCSITLIESYSCGYFEVHICLPSGEPPEQLAVICPQIRQTLYDAISADVNPKDAFICSMPTCEHKEIIEEERQTAKEEHLKNEKKCNADIDRIQLKLQQESIEDAEELTDLEVKLNVAKKTEMKRYEAEVARLDEKQRHAAVFEEDNLLQCTKGGKQTQRLKEDDQRYMYVWCPEKMSSVKKQQPSSPHSQTAEVFRSLLPKLVKAVHSPNDFAIELYASKLIAFDMADDICTLNLSKNDKSRKLMMSLQARLEGNPSDFEAIMTVFENSTALSPGIADKLRQLCDSLKAPGTTSAALGRRSTERRDHEEEEEGKKEEEAEPTPKTVKKSVRAK